MKRKKGFFLLESVISIAILSIIAVVVLSVILNSYKYTQKSKVNYLMLNEAKNQLEILKIHDYDYIFNNYIQQNIKSNGFNISAQLKEVNLNNCKKLIITVNDGHRDVKLSTYKVIK